MSNQWTNSSASIPRPYRSPYGSYNIRHYQESTAAGTAVIKVGDLVQFDTVVTTGNIRLKRHPAIGGAGTNLADSSITASLIGIALAGSTSDGSTTGLPSTDIAGSGLNRMIPVALADGVQEFIGYFKTAVTAGADVAASSLTGLNRAMTYDSTLQVYFVDSTNSTAANRFVTITEIPQNEVGSCGGSPVVFKFMSSLVNNSVKIGGAIGSAV